MLKLEEQKSEVLGHSKIVNELLNDDRYHIEFNGHLTNHAKHAVIALDGLGLDDTKIKEYYQNHAKETAYGYGLEPAQSSTYKITKNNWEEFLGKRTSFSSYYDFFDSEEKETGLEQVLATYMPVLLLGWVGAFTHATIHLGWALSINNRHMILEGLAYMAFTYVSCHPERSLKENTKNLKDNSPLDSLITIAKNWEEQGEELKLWVKETQDESKSEIARKMHPELKRSGLQYRIACMIGKGHPLMYESPAWLIEEELSTLWKELYYVASLLYLSKPGDFVILHLITSLYAMENIASYLPDSQKRKVVECYWIGMLGILFSSADFPKTKKLLSIHRAFENQKDSIDSPVILEEWRHIVARAVQEEEEHNPKLVFVLKKIWELDKGKTIYRAASGQFTQTPDLPPSFEASPMDEKDVKEYFENTQLTSSIIGNNLHLLPQSPYLRSLHTTIRNKEVSRGDFVFYSGKIMNKLVETSINLMNLKKDNVFTPIGELYEGLKIPKNICGVSIMRAGESMEIALRESLPSIRIGKILIQRDKITKLPHLYYTALPDDIASRHVLLMDPMLATGGTAIAAINTLIQKGVAEESIIFVNLITVPKGINALHKIYPKVKIVTSAIDKKLNENAYMIPGIGDFGDRYFGTDN